MNVGHKSPHKQHQESNRIQRKLKNELTAKTWKGITPILINVDLTPEALKNPTDPEYRKHDEYNSRKVQ